MHGLVTLLPPPFYEQVESIWDRLEQQCGLKGIRVTPYPHFSWQIAEDYDFARLETAMRRLAGEISPFRVRTAGLGLFTGISPVLYIPVARNRRLAELHQRIWQAAEGFGREVSEYYNDDNWAPHISLAYEDLDRETLPQALDQMASETVDWEFLVDNVSLIVEPTGEIGKLEWRIPLAGWS